MSATDKVRTMFATATLFAWITAHALGGHPSHHHYISPRNLCANRARLFQSNPRRLPVPRRQFITTALQHLRTPDSAVDTCGEELLTYLLEHTADKDLAALANELGLRSSAQIEILTKYRFLLIEGEKSFNNDREPQALLSFFNALQQAYNLKALNKGLTVMSLQKSNAHNGSTIPFNSGKLAAVKIARISVGYGEGIRDSIDNHKLLTADKSTMVMIHEISHGIFETESLPPSSPFYMKNGRFSRQPNRFSQDCFIKDSGESTSIDVEQVINFYESLLDEHAFTADAQAELELSFRPSKGDTSELRRRLPTRMPTQKARFYGASSYAEDWSTTWEAYFYNSQEMWQEALERERLGLGAGLKRRFLYLANAFASAEGSEHFTYIFDSTGEGVQAKRVKINYDEQGTIIGFEDLPQT